MKPKDKYYPGADGFCSDEHWVDQLERTSLRTLTKLIREAQTNALCYAAMVARKYPPVGNEIADEILKAVKRCTLK